MKKKELGITKGEAKINSVFRSEVWGFDTKIASCGSDNCSNIYRYKSDREINANASLIADAFNTANKCGLLPSELLEQRDGLLEVVKRALSISDLWTYGELICEEHICEARALAKMKLEFKNTINQIEQ